MTKDEESAEHVDDSGDVEKKHRLARFDFPTGASAEEIAKALRDARRAVMAEKPSPQD